MATDGPKLVVWAKDNTKVSYLLEDSPKISFTNEYLVITTNSVEVDYELSQMARITYENIDVSSIVNIKGESVNPFNFNGESLLFPSSDVDISVRVYTTDGKLVLERNVNKGENLAVPLNSFNSGIYLVHVNGITYKIVKR